MSILLLVKHCLYYYSFLVSIETKKCQFSNLFFSNYCTFVFILFFFFWLRMFSFSTDLLTCIPAEKETLALKHSHLENYSAFGHKDDNKDLEESLVQIVGHVIFNISFTSGFQKYSFFKTRISNPNVCHSA